MLKKLLFGLGLMGELGTQQIQNKNQKTFSKNAVQDLDDSWTAAPGSVGVGHKRSSPMPQVYKTPKVSFFWGMREVEVNNIDIW